MPKPLCTEQEFIEKWQRLGSPSLVAQELGSSPRAVMERRRSIANRLGIDLSSTNDQSSRSLKARINHHQGRFDLEIDNGTVLVFSDAHYWPGLVSTAHRALIHFCKKLKPVAVVNGGDSFDGATISRFPRPFFDEAKPTVAQELECVSDRLFEIAKAAKSAKLIWCLGNHDLRFESRLAAGVPQYEGVSGFHLKDHFPGWHPAWSAWINGEVEIRHRYKGGIHATHNNVMSNHHTTITGHLHSLKVTPYTDGRGVTKYGVDTGTLSDPMGPQFADYLEGRCPSWRSGFAVLTFHNGRLLPPELAEVIDEGVISFRGAVVEV